VGIATIALYKGVINSDKGSVFYNICNSGYNIFKPGYYLGFVLGFVGGGVYVIVGQIITFLFFFILIRVLFVILQDIFKNR
jgi:hypothetical protein